VQEISLLMACYTDNNFDRKKCATQLAQVEDCMVKAQQMNKMKGAVNSSLNMLHTGARLKRKHD